MKNLKKFVFFLLLTLLLTLAPLAAQSGPAADAKTQKMFQAGKDAVHNKDWKAAVDQWTNFNVTFPQSQWGGEPYYWLAYSLNQAARESGDAARQTAMREQAMVKTEMLLNRFGESNWAADARMLRIELAEALVRAGKTQYKKYITRGAEAENGSDFNIKLVALDALLQMNEEKALPILKKIIKENKDKNIRAKAIFVLSQHNDPSVPLLLGEIARKDEDLHVREQAIFWLGQNDGGLRILIDLYASLQERTLREKVLFAFSQSSDEAAFRKLLEIAKTDPDLGLREKAVFWIGQSSDSQAPAALVEMYKANSDLELKKKIIFSLGQLDNDKGTAFLKEIAGGNSDDRLKGRCGVLDRPEGRRGERQHAQGALRRQCQPGPEGKDPLQSEPEQQSGGVETPVRRGPQ